MRFRASHAARAIGGRLIGPDAEIDGVSFDSRTVAPGQLFVPLVDQRDGHDFIDGALARGAAGYLTAREPGAGTAIVVDDTLQALMQLARHQLAVADEVTVIGITGSVGKTSTKDLAWAGLAASHRTWANERSFNNDQGMPTTVLNAPDDTEVMVLEMGMRGFGEIARLCGIAAPTIGVVTRVAEAHSDRVGGIEGVFRAKAELVDALPSHGIAILNADDHRVRAMSSRCAGSVLLFGEADDADVRITGVVLDDVARASFVVHTPWGATPVRLAVSGRHMVSNAAAALACVGAVGGELQAAAAAMGEVRLAAMRMEILHTADGATVLNDSYNANPTSMRAALDALVVIPAVRRFAVLGVMAEIADRELEHRGIHAYAVERGIEVIAVGTDLYGVVPVPDPVVALALLELGVGDAVLVKGSRVAGLEHVAEAVSRPR